MILLVHDAIAANVFRILTNDVGVGTPYGRKRKDPVAEIGIRY